MSKKKRSIFFMIVIVLIVLGQIIKQAVVNNINSIIIIKGFLKISFVKNTGGAFGLGSNYIWIFIIMNLIILTAIVFIIFKKKSFNRLEFLGGILVLSGGTGNLIDRIFRGYVVDYIDINEVISYPVFNLEDICIVVGIIIIMLNIIILECRGRTLGRPDNK